MEGDGGLTWYQIAGALTSLVVLAYAWIFTRVISDQAKLERRMSEHEQLTRDKFDELPDRYVRRDDFGQFKADVMRMLERIHADQQLIASKLDNKADKP
jgi:methyl-accepting chemotaxis protein